MLGVVTQQLVSVKVTLSGWLKAALFCLLNVNNNKTTILKQFWIIFYFHDTHCIMQIVTTKYLVPIYLMLTYKQKYTPLKHRNCCCYVQNYKFTLCGSIQDHITV